MKHCARGPLPGWPALLRAAACGAVLALWPLLAAAGATAATATTAATAATSATAAAPAAPATRAAVVAASPTLPAAVLRALQGSGLPLDSFGLHVLPVTAKPGTVPLATLNAEVPYVLASTAKLVTAMAGLELLGPNYRWRTHAFVTGPIVDGVLQGDLLIVGGGNPIFSSRDLREWMQQMRSKGLHGVAGNILVDRSAFAFNEGDHDRTPPPLQPRHVWPDSLMVDAGLMQVRVQPARGKLAHVITEPPLAGVTVVNKVGMQGGCTAWAHWAEGPRADTRSEPRTPATRAATTVEVARLTPVVHHLGPPGQAAERTGGRYGDTRARPVSAPAATAAAQPELVVQGQWGQGCGSRPITLLAPARHNVAVHAMAGMWADVGGSLRGRVLAVDLSTRNAEHKRLPLFAADGELMLPWSTHISEPLPLVVREMNKSSNNLTARHLMLSLTKGFPVKSASIEGAQASLQAWLKRQGMQDGDIALDNGSGLSRGERGRPRALAQLLVTAWASPVSRHFVESLPVAGVDGTLAHRMMQGAATGRAFLKTGSLNDTRALAGYVQGVSGRFYAVAAIVNHLHAAQATPALDAVIEWLAKNG